MPNILEHQFGLFSQKCQIFWECLNINFLGKCQIFWNINLAYFPRNIGNVLTSIFWENAKYFGTSIWLIFPEIYWECLNINFLGKCQIFWNINLAYFPRNLLGMSEHQFSGKMPNILEHQFGLFSQKSIGNVLTSIFWENAKYFGTSIWLIFPEIYWECLNINFLGKCQIFWNINLAYFPRNIGNVLTSIFWENAKYFGTSIWLIFPEIYWECLNINFLGKCQIFWNINLAYFPRNLLGMS